MGVGSITDAREVTHGEVRGGGRTLEPQGAHVDLAGAHVDPLHARQIRIDDMRDVALAVQRNLYEKPVEEAEQELRNYDLTVRKEGYRDENGVQCHGLETLSGEQAMNVASEYRRRMDAKFAELTRGFDETRRRMLHDRWDADFNRRHAVLAEYGAVQFAGAEVERVDKVFADTLKREVVDVSDTKLTDLALSGLAEIGTGSEVVAEEREKADANDAAMFVDRLILGREAYVAKMVQVGLGKTSEAKAREKADAEILAASTDAIRSLVAGGNYNRARRLVEQGKRLGYDDAAIARGRELVDAAEIEQAVNAANVAINAVRDADGNWPAGRVEEIDRAITTVQRVGATQKKDSKLAVSAAEAAAKLDRHADEIRIGEFFDGFSQAQLDHLDLGKMKNPYKKGTRDARCWDAARTAWVKNLSPEFNRKRAAARKDAINLMKAKQLDYARQNPAKYYEDLVGLERNGMITELDRKELIQKFEKGWMRGFVGQGNEQAMLLQKAEAVAKTLDEELGGAFRTEIRRDNDGFIMPAADGSLVYDSKATPKDLTWSEEVTGKAKMRIVAPGWSVYTPSKHTVTHTLTAEEKLKIANKALALAKFDGMELGYDPVTEIPMDNGEKYKVNLITDLKRMCRIQKSRKEAERARDQVFDYLRRGKPATVGDAIGGIDPLAAVMDPRGSFGAITRTISDYDAEVQADRTKAEGRKFSLGKMLQGLEDESRIVKD